jgi:monoamine oxidase
LLTVIYHSGGSNEIAQKMYDSIRTRAKVRFEKRVTKIEKGLNSSMAVTTSDRTTRTYSQVISSIPLPCLNMVDLDGLSLNWDIKSALRALAYGPATKIGIMFTQNWWEPLGIVGGQSYTDSLLRTVVYPSYPESGPKSRVLIVSYCWTQDALRMGSLFATDPASEKILLNLVLDELQKVHGFSVRQYYDEKTCRIFPWNWYSDNLTLGMSSNLLSFEIDLE